MSSYPPPDNQPPNYPQPDQPYGAPPNYPQPDQPYGAPPNYPPAANPYGTPPGYPPAANPYGAPPGYPSPDQQYGAPPNYPQQNYGMPYQMAATQSNGLAIASLVLGILAVFFWILTGIPAVITGHIALSRIKANPLLSGRGLAIAGLILGYISIALAVLFILLIIIGSAVGRSAN